VAEQAADDATTSVADEDAELNLVRMANDGAIELDEPLGDDACVIVAGAFLELDTKGSHAAEPATAEI
jgi:hypothetical protein